MSSKRVKSGSTKAAAEPAKAPESAPPAATDAAPSAAPPAPPSDSLLFSSLYSVSHYQERIAALESETKSLQNRLSIAQADFQSLQSSRAQSIAHLQRELLKKDARINELMAEVKSKDDCIAALEASAAKEKEELIRKQSQEMGSINDRMEDISTKFRSVEQYLVEKSSLENELKTLKKTLEEEKRAHFSSLAELERKSVIEREKLKQEMVRRLKETKLKLLSMTEEQLHSTTKRTILENEQMGMELQYQSRETERIMKLNQELLEENRTLKREAELKRDAAVLMAKKTNFYHKLAQKMQKKLEHQGAMGIGMGMGMGMLGLDSGSAGLLGASGAPMGFLPSIRGNNAGDENAIVEKRGKSSSNAAIKSAVKGKFGLHYIGNAGQGASAGPSAVSLTGANAVDRDEKERDRHEKDRRQLELIKFLKQENEILQKNLQEIRDREGKMGAARGGNGNGSGSRGGQGSRVSRRRETNPMEPSEQELEAEAESEADFEPLESSLAMGSESATGSRTGSRTNSRPQSRK